jgi:tetratricopeptide (TPR) repeat protein
LRQAKEASKPIHLAFIGERAAGKTSFLNITANEAKRRNFCVVRVDLDEGDATTQLAFFRKLYHQIASQAFALGGFGGRKSKTYEAYLDLISTYKTEKGPEYQPLTFANVIARALDANRSDIAVPDDILKDDLKLISDELARPIIILIDECNVLKSSRIILEKLRNLFMSMTGYMLVFAATKDLFPLIDDIFSPIMRQFKQIEIGAFTKRRDTEFCMRRRLSHAGVPAPERERLIPNSIYSDVHVLSGGRPYEIQLICHFLFRQCQMGHARKFVLDIASVDQIQKGISGGRNLATRRVINAARQLRRQTLQAFASLALAEEKLDFESYWKIEYMVHGTQNFTRDQLRGECDILVSERILVEDSTGLSFDGDSFDRLYIKYVARQKGVRGRVTSLPLDSAMSTIFEDMVYPFLQFVMPIFIEMSSSGYDLGYLSEFLKKLEGGEPPDSFPFPIEVLLMECLIRDKTSNGLLFELTFTSPLVRMKKIFFWEDPTREANLSRLFARAEEMAKRAELLGWSLRLDHRPLSLPARTLALDLLTRFGDERLRDRIASSLLRQMPQKYVEYRDKDMAQLLADTAFAVSGTRQTGDACNVGYLHMAQGNLDEAKAWFDAAEQRVAEENDVALLHYNYAMYWLLKGDKGNARLRIQHASRVLVDDRYRVGALLIPVQGVDGKFAMKEVFERPVLREAISRATLAIGDDL